MWRQIYRITRVSDSDVYNKPTRELEKIQFVLKSRLSLLTEDDHLNSYLIS